MKPQKMKAYASFDEWKLDQSAKNQRLINALSGLVMKTAAELTRTVNWGQGCWTRGDAPKVYIHAEPAHVPVFTTRGIPREELATLVQQVL